MFKRPVRCVNPECPYHLNPPKDFLAKRGKYKIKATGKIVQRYLCKHCGASFSNRNTAPDRGQRRDINKALFGFVCSGITIRRAALLLEVSVNTVRERMAWLADRAREAHSRALADGSMLTEYAQFDEMETFLHSKAKPLTIAIVVRAKTGQILSIKVGRIPTKGKLAKKGKAMGWTVNDGPLARANALREAAQSIHPGATIACDGFPTYPAEIRANVGKGVTVNAQPFDPNGGFDPMFRLNHVCAKIRADVACMARETWTTTKRVDALQDRMDIYVAWNNGYSLI